MSTLQGESFYFHHGWHFLRADAFPMAKAVDAHRDAEGHAFYEADYRETGWQPVTLPHTFNDEDLFRDRIQDGGSGQRRTAAFYRNIQMCIRDRLWVWWQVAFHVIKSWGIAKSWVSPTTRA